MFNKLLQFWQELKRRNVVRVVSIYAGAAFVFLELVDMITEPLNLPDWMPRLVIILAVIGFPVVTLLSWIFDLTPGGIVKTEPVKATSGTSLENKSQVPSEKRKLKLGDVVIAVLVIVVGILAYPRIVKGSANLRTMTMPLTVVNEFGEKETKRVFKEDYISRIALLPFVNADQDSSANWIKGIIHDALWVDFRQFNNIVAHDDYNTVHLNEQIEFAKTRNLSHFLTGSYRMDQGNYELTSKLYQSENGSLLMERTYRGKDLLNLLDSICHDSRRDIGISDDILNSTPDLPIAEMTTHNLNAYKVYAGGYDDNTIVSSAYKAFQLDSTFAYALLHRTLIVWTAYVDHKNALRDIDQVMRHRQRLSYYDELLTRQLYFEIHGDTEKAIALAKTQVGLHPYDYMSLESLADLYLKEKMLDQAEKAWQELNELVPDHPKYMINLARILLYNGKYKEGLEILDQWLLDDPVNTQALLMKAEFYLNMKDYKAAEEVIKRTILISPEQEDKWSLLLDHIDYIQNNKMSRSLLESYTGNYRNEYNGQAAAFSINNDQLYYSVVNQSTTGNIGYPVSDTFFVSQSGILFIIQSFFKDKNGNVAGIEITQSNYQNSDQVGLNAWKEYPLILKAEKLLSEDKLTEALDTFLLAHDQYPAHYYLSNYVQHLEYILNLENEELDSLFKSYAGEYNDGYLYTEDQKLFFRGRSGVILDLLPLTDSIFMIPTIYGVQFQMLSENGRKTGLKIVYKDGGEQYYPRNVDPQTNRTPNQEN